MSVCLPTTEYNWRRSNTLHDGQIFHRRSTAEVLNISKLPYGHRRHWRSAAFTHGYVCALWRSTAFIYGFWTAAERRQKPPMCNSGLKACFLFHGITAVVRKDTLSCAHLQQQYDQDWSSGGSVAALVRKPHALSRLHGAQSRFAAFVAAHTRCTHVHWCSLALRHYHSRSLAEARHFLTLTHYKRKWRRAQ